VTVFENILCFVQIITYTHTQTNPVRPMPFPEPCAVWHKHVMLDGQVSKCDVTLQQFLRHFKWGSNVDRHFTQRGALPHSTLPADAWLDITVLLGGLEVQDQQNSLLEVLTSHRAIFFCGFGPKSQSTDRDWSRANSKCVPVGCLWVAEVRAQGWD
jgi:hypothetical protein